MIPQDNLYRSNIEASQCDVMLVIGTSALVQPAASIPSIAKSAGACIIEINPQKTPLTGSVADISLTGNAGGIMEKLLKKIGEI
jgi:NAD-dependent deacetylase